MIKKLLEYIQDKKISRTFKRHFSATQEEMNTTRELFMAHVRSEFPFSNPQSQLSWKMYSAFAVLALFIGLNTGALIYADTANVPVNHPLYTYKRVAEEVRGFTSTPSEKVKLEAQLAERRMQEIERIERSEIKKSDKKESITASSTATTTSTTPKKDKIKNLSKKEKELESLKKNLEMHLKALEQSADKKPDVKNQIEKSDFCKTDGSKKNNELTAKLAKLCSIVVPDIKASTTAPSEKSKDSNNNKKKNLRQD